MADRKSSLSDRRMNPAGWKKARLRARVALLLAMALLCLPLLASACVLRPSLPSTTAGTSILPSDTTAAGTDPSGTADPSGTSGTAGTAEPSVPSPSGSETGAPEPSDTQPSESSTSETTGTSAQPTGSNTEPGTPGETGGSTGTTGTVRPGTSTSASPTGSPATTMPGSATAPATTRPPVQTTTQAPATTAATTTQAATGSFPVRSYGTFFRNEYGANANIITSSDGAVSIDVGSCPQGVVLVKVNTPDDGLRWKGILKGPTSTYQYDLLKRGSWEGVPLQFGNGSYTLTVYEQVSGTSYTPRMAHTFSVTLNSSLSPFLASSIIVSFSSSSASTSRAAALVSGKTSQSARIEAIYLWIVQNITYDRVLASSITSGQTKTYIPSPDATMASRKGICYDYAALMAAMLRSQGIPARLIMGQVPQGYHAWNEVYIAGTGWVVIASFNYSAVDGSAWVMFDSTFAAGGMSSQTILNTTHTKERTY